jgi:branched-subunit amino acid transport protein
MNNELVMIVGMMLVTFLPRWGTLALLGRVEMPKPLFRALKFVPPVVLSAIILPSMLLKDGNIFIAPQNSFLASGIIAGLVAWRTRNLLLTIVIGMASLFIWRAVIGG